MEEKDDDDERDDDRFLDKGVPERVDRLANQARAIVGRNNPHAWRQRCLHLLQLRLHAVDHAQRILAEPHDDDAADGFAFAIEFGDAPADIRADPYLRDVAHANRGATRVGAQGHVLDVRDRRQVAAATDHVFAARELEQPALDVVVAHLDRVDHLLHADVVGRQLVGIEVHLVLLDEPAYARHFGHARH